jgi:hypothetical protein
MRHAFMFNFLFAAQPAFAACHRYSVWAYPWPQSCRLTPDRPHHVSFNVSPPVPPVPPAPPQAFDEDAARSDAINTLRALLQ